MHFPKGNTSTFAPAPAGTHAAVCIRVIDVGTHTTEFQGERKSTRQVMITWELPFEFMENGKPFIHTNKYTLSAHEKSTLRRHLESWRGKPFTDADFGAGGFDIKSILGKSCTLLLKAQIGKDGGVYNKLEGVGQPTKGVAAPSPLNPLIYLSLDPERFDTEVFNALSDKMRERIMASPEYAALSSGGKTKAKSDEPDDDMPF